MVRGEKINQVRVEIARAEQEGKILRPIELIKRLAERGIHIPSGQASAELKKFRHHRAEARRQLAAEEQTNGHAEPEETVMVLAPDGSAATYDELLFTAQFARQCGGLERARDLLLQLTTVVDPFTTA